MNENYKIYPYPVLWNNNDDYVDSYFNVNVDIKKEIGTIRIDVIFDLNNSDLKKMILNENAEYLIRVSSYSFYRTIKTTKNDVFSFYLKDKDLLDKVYFNFFIVAKTNLKSYYNKNFNKDYEETKFDIEKGSILAIGESIYFNINSKKENLSKTPSIFTVYKKETDEETPLEIELNDHKISIGLNKQDYEYYIMHSSNSLNILNSIIILPALIFIFERLKEDFNSYSDYRWFDSIKNLFEKNKQPFNEEFLLNKTSLELSQKVMLYPISKSLSNINELTNDEE